MPDLFVPLDVNFQDDDKLLAVSAEAELVYLRAMALSKRLLSDGFIARVHMRRLCDKIDKNPDDLADELVDAGLLAPTSPPNAPLDRGYRIVAWLKHNRPADEIREASEQGRRGSLIRWHREGKHDGQPAEGCPECRNASPLASPPSSPLDGEPMGGPYAHSEVEHSEVETERDADASSDNGQVDEQFEDFWDRYPRHAVNGKLGGGGSKKKSQQKWTRLTDNQRQACMDAVDNYREWCQHPDGEYPAHATTWLNEARWEQWQEPADIQPAEVPVEKRGMIA